MSSSVWHLDLEKIQKTNLMEEAREATDHVETHIEELNSKELGRQSTQVECAESVRFGEAAKNRQFQEWRGSGPKNDEDPYEALKRKPQCTVM